MRRAPRLVLVCALALGAAACLKTTYDITTNERLVRVPRSGRTDFTIDTGRIELPTKLGEDKIVREVVLELDATNLNTENPVEVDMSASDSREPNVFRPIATFDVGAGGTRAIRVVQTDPQDALVRAVTSDFVNIKFESRSPAPGIGEIEFRFTIHVLADKDTPGTGAGTLIFY